MKLDIANFLSKITLEPTVFTLYFGIQLEKGARITTDLLFNQVCHYEQNNTQEICASLTNGSFEGKCSNKNKANLLCDVGIYLVFLPDTTTQTS